MTYNFPIKKQVLTIPLPFTFNGRTGAISLAQFFIRCNISQYHIEPSEVSVINDVKTRRYIDYTKTTFKTIQVAQNPG